MTIFFGYTGVIDDLLRKRVTNSEVCLERIPKLCFSGSVPTVKRNIKEHKDLVPSKLLFPANCLAWEFVKKNIKNLSI